MRSLNFIGGEKGGVGKSVLARVIAQYFIDRERPFIGFDTDRSHQSLRRFYADYASATVVDSYEGLDAIAEGLAEDEECSALVDLAAQTFSPLASWIHDSDLLGVLEELSVAVNFWHVMDGSGESVALLESLFDTYGESVNYVLVFNQGRASDFSIFAQSPLKARAESLGAVMIELPKLHEASMRKIDLHNTSFWAAVNVKASGKEGLGLLERQRVKVWLQKAYENLDQVL